MLFFNRRNKSKEEEDSLDATLELSLTHPISRPQPRQLYKCDENLQEETKRDDSLMLAGAEGYESEEMDEACPYYYEPVM